MEYDESKEEAYKMVQYHEMNDIVPNKIYGQVFEDNQKFEFENDVYSKEFFDFIQSITSSVVSLNTKQESALMTSINS